MKYLAILKDSLLEAIDTKVFYVTLAISLLLVLTMATLSFEPDPPDEGLRNIASRFTRTVEKEYPVFGKVPVAEPLVEFQVDQIERPNESAKPWDDECRITLDVTDTRELGWRVILLVQMVQAEERRARAGSSGRSGRFKRWALVSERLAEKAKELETAKDLETREARAKEIDAIEEELRQELIALTNDELEPFLRQQFENQANWTVSEIKLSERTPVKLKRIVVVPDKDALKITTKEVNGELNRFQITLKSRNGTYRLWPHKASMLFGAVPLGSNWQPGYLVYFIQKYLVSSIGASVIMLLSCIITSFFIPNMLRKGTIDLLLAKPIHRWALLAYKYVGGLTFMFLNTVVIVGGIWLVMGVRTGIWEPAVLVLILVLTFQFALFYAVSTLAAVVTRSPIVCILSCVLLWAFLYGVGWAYYGVDQFRVEPAEGEGPLPRSLVTTVDFTRAILPRYSDFDSLGTRMLYTALHDPSEAERKRLEKEYKSYYWDESIYVTLVWIALMLALACWRFSVRDY